MHRRTFFGAIGVAAGVPSAPDLSVSPPQSLALDRQSVLPPECGRLARGPIIISGRARSPAGAGAKGDVRIVNVRAARGDNVIHGNFSGADVGKLIAIPAAKSGDSRWIAQVLDFGNGKVVVDKPIGRELVAESAYVGTDDTDALKKVFDWGMPIEFPEGIFFTRDTLEVSGTSGRSVIAAAPGRERGGTAVVGLMNNRPILRIWGSRHRVSGFWLEFFSAMAVDDLGATCLETKAGEALLNSELSRLVLRHGRVALSLDGSNLDSLNIESVTCSRWSYSGFYCGEEGAKTSATGCSINNLYLANQYEDQKIGLSKFYPFALVNFSDCFLGKIAVEWTDVLSRSAYLFSNVNSAFVGDARVERVRFSRDNSAFIVASGKSSIVVGSFQANFCTFQNSGKLSKFFNAATYGPAVVRYSSISVRDMDAGSTNVAWAMASGNRSASPFGGVFFDGYNFDASWRPVGRVDGVKGPQGQGAVRSLMFYGAKKMTGILIPGKSRWDVEVAVKGASVGDCVLGISFDKPLNGCTLAAEVLADDVVRVSILNTDDRAVSVAEGLLRVSTTMW